MMENNFNNFEIKKEKIPTLEEIVLVFKELTDKEYKELRRCEDELGLYLLEITVPGDLDGETIEYAYMREGRYKEGQSSSTEIHVTYYDDGMPIGGTSAARIVDGAWKIL